MDMCVGWEKLQRRGICWVISWSRWKTSRLGFQKFNMWCPKIYSESHRIRFKQRYTEITHGPLLFSVAQGIFCLSSERLSRSAFKRGERRESVLLYPVVLQCIDASVRIVTKSPKVGPLLIFIFSISLGLKVYKTLKNGTGYHRY